LPIDFTKYLIFQYFLFFPQKWGKLVLLQNQ
jgi:hypothetical protein